MKRISALTGGAAAGFLLACAGDGGPTSATGLGQAATATTPAASLPAGKCCCELMYPDPQGEHPSVVHDLMDAAECMNAAAPMGADCMPPTGDLPKECRTDGICGASQTLFDCTTDAGKHVAFCKDGADVQYRFGKPGNVELQYPAGGKGAFEGHWGNIGDDEGRPTGFHYDRMTFTNQGVDGKAVEYTVFSEPDTQGERKYGVWMSGAAKGAVSCTLQRGDLAFDGVPSEQDNTGIGVYSGD